MVNLKNKQFQLEGFNEDYKEMVFHTPTRCHLGVI